MRPILPLLLLTTPAAAHTGHLAAAGGHDHWGLAIGLGVIAGAAVIGWVRGRRGKSDENGDAEPEPEEAATEAASDAEEQPA